jgi:glyoxylase-like metal-dependent hydrolase (beta-lactamase superfamily II)
MKTLAATIRSIMIINPNNATKVLTLSGLSTDVRNVYYFYINDYKGYTMTNSLKKLSAIAAITLCSACIAISAQAAKLNIKVFNPGANSLFPVSSTLVTGPTQAVLIDAQFQRDDANSVLKMIQASGKELTTIYISHGDPDFYFGLDVIAKAYPKAKIVASAPTIAHIKATVKGKVSYWGPILAENAPQETIVPQRLTGDSINVDGEALKIVGLSGHDPKHTFVWIPSLETVAGGVSIYENVHVWMADNQSSQSRNLWMKTLDSVMALAPKKIIPGHFIGNSSMDTNAVSFTQSYVHNFIDAAINAENSAKLVSSMKEKYPSFKNEGDLALSAKVIKGEMQWP